MATLFGQVNPTGITGYALSTDATASYGVMFTVAKPSTASAIWYYSPASATNLPVSVSLYAYGNSTALVTNASPSWSGAAGSGWVSATIPATAINPGTTYVASFVTASGAGTIHGYLFTGASPADLFPATSSDGNITAPSTVSGNPNGPYQNGSSGLPGTYNANNLNWLVDVEVEPIQVVQTSSTGGFSSASTFSTGTTAGNTVVVVITDYNSGGVMTPQPPTLGGSVPYGTFLADFSQENAAGGSSVAVAIYVCPNVAAGLTAIVGTTMTAGSDASTIAYEVAGLGPNPMVDQTVANGSTTGTAISSGATGAISSSAEFVVAGACGYAVAVGGATPPAAPWVATQGSDSGYSEFAYQLPSSAGGTYTLSSTASTGGVWTAVVATIKATPPVFNPIKDTNPANPVVQADTSDYVFGYYFTATSNCWITGIWWFCDVAGGQYNNSAGDEHIALWTVTGAGGANENYVASSVATAGTYSQGWNFIPFGSPIALTAGVEYMAAKEVQPKTHGASAGYCTTSNFFSSTGAGANGFSAGPVLVYSSDASPLGTSNKEPNGNGQMQFYTAAAAVADATSQAPNSGFNATWYGMDIRVETSIVQVDSVAPATLPDGVTSGTTHSWTQNVTGPNPAVLAAIEVDAFIDGGITTAVTFNGATMTSLGRVESDASTHGYLQVYGLAGVATGIGTIAVTASGGTPDDMAGASISFKNVNQTTPFGTPGTGSGVGTALSAATAGSTAGNLVAGFAASGSSIASATSPATPRVLNNYKPSGGADNTGNVAAATSLSTGSAVTMAWTAGNNTWAALAVEVLVAGGGSPPPVVQPVLLMACFP